MAGKFAERARKHFAERLNEQWTVDVPEWPDENGNALVIHVRPVNVRERNAIFQFAKDQSLEASVETLVQRARDHHGMRMFKTEDDRNVLLREADPEVIDRIAREINRDLAEAMEDEASVDPKN